MISINTVTKYPWNSQGHDSKLMIAIMCVLTHIRFIYRSHVKRRGAEIGGLMLACCIAQMYKWKRVELEIYGATAELAEIGAGIILSWRVLECFLGGEGGVFTRFCFKPCCSTPTLLSLLLSSLPVSTPRLRPPPAVLAPPPVLARSPRASWIVRRLPSRPLTAPARPCQSFSCANSSSY